MTSQPEAAAKPRSVAFRAARCSLRRVEGEVRESPTCKNCDTPLTGEYCSKCGQRDYDFNRSFREIGADIAESFFNWDTKLIRATYDLLFRPGVLTKSYLDGKRMSQVPPLRFYLFVSILFFLVGSFGPADAIRFDEPNQNVRVEDLPLDPRTKAKVEQAQKGFEERRAENPDSTEVWIEEFFKDRMNRREEIARMLKDYFPNLVFALLPAFALITRLVFRKAKLGFLSHLVMALHLHTFFFLFVLVERGWGALIELVSPTLSSLFRLAAVLYIIAYAILAARRVFGRTLWGTIWRLLVTSLLYWVAFGVGFAILMIIILLAA